MNRRNLLGALGVSAASFSALSAIAADDDKKDGKEMHHHGPAHTECLDACEDCAKACDEAFNHCTMMLAEGKKEHAMAMRLASDCSDFCELSACMISRHSPLMMYSCGACAETCKKTMVEMKKFDSPEMKAAVKALERCESSCSAMIKSMGGHEHHDHHDSDKK